MAGKNIIKKNLVSIILLLLLSNFAYAKNQRPTESFFASLRSKETNVRAGPAGEYPIKFSFKVKGVPVLVIGRYENWSEIEDYDGQSGWVNQNLLTKKRTLMVRTTQPFINMYAKSNRKSRILFRLENNVIGDYIECDDIWCRLKVNNKKGWVEKTNLFGY